MTELRLRTAASTLPGYTPGKPPSVHDDRPSYKLSSNENPHPPLPSVAAAISERIALTNRYPNTADMSVQGAIAERFGVAPTQVTLGAGSVEVLSQVISATSGSGNEVLYAWRSFEAYPLLIANAGATPVAVPLTPELRHDLDAMADAVTERTSLILVCTPNNPTGTSVTAEELERFLARIPSDIVVVIDEAYIEYRDAADAARGIDFFGRYPNVALLHTFSKAYGLAGLRIGYAIAPEPLVAAMRRAAVPFGVTDLARAAARASLTEKAQLELTERVDEVIRTRVRLEQQLRAQGWDIPTSLGNFVWLPTGTATRACTEIFDRHGLSVRGLGDDGIRITVAEPESVEALLAAAAEALSLISAS